MHHPWTFLLLVSMSVWAAPPASAQSVEDQAGIMLFEAGKKAFDRGRHDQAAEKFEKALTVAFGGDVSAAPVPLLNMLGRSYAELGRCEEAVPVLVAAESSKAPPKAAKARTKAEVTCRRELAGLAVAEGRCTDAMPHLKALARHMRGSQLRWLDHALAGCEKKLTAFDTSTPDRRASYQLFEAARVQRAERDFERAAELYRKALAVTDEVLIRVELAEVLVRLVDCPGVVEVLAPVPGEHLSEALRVSQQRCAQKVESSSPSEERTLSAPAEPPPASGGSGMVTLGWLSLGVGVAGIVAGGLLISLGETEVERQQSWEALADDAIDSGEQELYIEKARVANKAAEGNRYGGIAALGIGVAAAATGVVLFVLDSGDDDPEAASVQVTPIISPSSMGLSVRF